MVFRIGQKVVFRGVPRHARGSVVVGVPRRQVTTVVDVGYPELKHWNGCPNPFNCPCLPNPNDQMVRLAGMERDKMIPAKWVRPVT